jgi:hypothetical protein
MSLADFTKAAPDMSVDAEDMFVKYFRRGSVIRKSSIRSQESGLMPQAIVEETMRELIATKLVWDSGRNRNLLELSPPGKKLIKALMK